MDLEKLVDQVTKEIMRQLQGSSRKQTVLLLGGNREMAATLGDRYQVDCGQSLANAGEYDFVVLPTACLNKADCGVAPTTAPAPCAGGQELDLTGKKLIHERELREKCQSNITGIRIDSKAIITSLAADLIRSRKLKVVRGG